MIRDIFFDLDRTLWDFEKNTRETLLDIYHEFDISRFAPSFDKFEQVYYKTNNAYWSAYREGKIEKDYLVANRFFDTIKKLGHDDVELGKKMGTYYIDKSPYQSILFPGTRDVLSSLMNKGYSLHIITNGFKQVQDIKLEYSDLRHFFKTVLCSDEVGVNKPNPLIFTRALENAQAVPEESLMIGDDLEGDVLGAKQVGIQGILFDPKRKINQSNRFLIIHQLSDIPELIGKINE